MARRSDPRHEGRSPEKGSEPTRAPRAPRTLSGLPVDLVVGPSPSEIARANEQIGFPDFRELTLSLDSKRRLKHGQVLPRKDPAHFDTAIILRAASSGVV